MSIEIIGYGVLNKYTREEFPVNKSSTVKDILNKLGVEDNLQCSLIAVRNSSAVPLHEHVYEGDKLELFILLSGG